MIHGGPHVLVPFVVKDGGRLGAHALALLKALDIVALEKDCQPPHAYRACATSTPTQASLWARRWHQHMSTWPNLAISKHVIRLMCRGIVARLRYI